MLKLLAWPIYEQVAIAAFDVGDFDLANVRKKGTVLALMLSYLVFCDRNVSNLSKHGLAKPHFGCSGY